MTPKPPVLKELFRCFHGLIPTLFATADAEGVPNIAYVSEVQYIDDRHVAVSRQFFNKTSRNLEANPRACAELIDPATMQAFRLHLLKVRSETSGPLFDTMAMRIQAIASQTGMAGVFRLIAADVFEVERIERVEGFLSEAPADVPQDDVSLDGVRTELKGVQFVSERINRAENLEGLLDAALGALDAYFNFRHTMVLLVDGDRLVTIASHGYGQSGVGAEIQIGDGLIGTAARERRLLRLTGLHASLRYGRAVRREAQKSGSRVAPEIPLPGLSDAQSTLVIPLSICDKLVGVLVAESQSPMRFDEWDETYLEVIGNQIALSIDRMQDREEETATVPGPLLHVSANRDSPNAVVAPARTLVYYRNDDCIFVDDEYLIRNVPARILWRLLTEWRARGRTEFTNRELRVDESLGLPEFKDNLESRLILLRKRLEEKCPDVRIVSTGRGRFALTVESNLGLVER